MNKYNEHRDLRPNNQAVKYADLIKSIAASAFAATTLIAAAYAFIVAVPFSGIALASIALPIIGELTFTSSVITYSLNSALGLSALSQTFKILVNCLDLANEILHDIEISEDSIFSFLNYLKENDQDIQEESDINLEDMISPHEENIFETHESDCVLHGNDNLNGDGNE